MSRAVAICAGVLVGLGARAAVAQPAPAPAPRLDPAIPQAWTAPTAWIQPAGSLTATASASAGGNDLGNTLLGASYGLGGLGSVALETDGDVHCASCASSPSAVHAARAAVRIGAHQDAWFVGQPALALGVRRSFAAADGADFVDAYVVASRELGRVRLHAGGAMIAASAPGRASLPATLRPFGAFEWTPSIYPRTTLVADLAWQPELEALAIRPQWVAGAGVRYQFATWGAISLAVRTRGRGTDAEGLDKAAVLIRLDVLWR